MKMVANNRKAYHDYDVLEKVESGVELTGTEIKSIRAGKVNLLDSYAVCKQGELFLQHMHISPFEQGNRFNHDPYRIRKLLLHKKEITRLSIEVERKHLTLIPLSLYFSRQWVKIELGLCKGRKKYDKRDKIAANESKKRLANVMKRPR
jgi:SsrA-binding protein